MQLESYVVSAEEAEKKKIQHVLNLEGGILKRVGAYVGLVDTSKLRRLWGKDYEACL